ncbi:hypothetical protein [Endozoicomonas sp.]|uniref:hypothetical protein n=1 Tax=Endozoicomonas sp. TaxID=1892382 RepID=UPI0028843013|nr:hypothetical protein [Endozoicomonas sp.]
MNLRYSAVSWLEDGYSDPMVKEKFPGILISELRRQRYFVRLKRTLSVAQKGELTPNLIPAQEVVAKGNLNDLDKVGSLTW